MTQTLYRFWQEDQLLYIGISINAYTRAAQHQQSSGWWPEADRVTFEHHECSRSAIEQMEREAIHQEHPSRNIMHNSERRRTKAAQGRHDAYVEAWLRTRTLLAQALFDRIWTMELPLSDSEMQQALRHRELKTTGAELELFVNSLKLDDETMRTWTTVSDTVAVVTGPHFDLESA